MNSTRRVTRLLPGLFAFGVLVATTAVAQAAPADMLSAGIIRQFPQKFRT